MYFLSGLDTPAQVGGTEIYVAGLVEGLLRRGHESEVVYVEEVPGGSDIAICSEVRQGVKVHAVTVPRSRYKMEFLIFDQALRARLLAELCAVVRSVAPDVIHLSPEPEAER
jgi:glycosyl transferase family 4